MARGPLRGSGSPVLGGFPCNTHQCYDWCLSPCLSQGNLPERQSRSQLGGSGQGKVWVIGLGKLRRLALPSPLTGGCEGLLQTQDGAWRLPLKTHQQFLQLGLHDKELPGQGPSHPPADSHTDLRKNISEKLTSV